MVSNSGLISQTYEESSVGFTVVLASLPTCTLNAEQLMDDHIVRPQFTKIAQNQVVTLECESGWAYLNSDINRTLTCIGFNIWNATEDACEGINYVCTLHKRFYLSEDL